jgi:alpha-mannosidase
MKIRILILSAFLTLSRLVLSQEIDYSKTKTLYVVGTAHFDTQWLWTIQTSINEYIPATMQQNFKLFEKYPDYKFSFEGAFKYMLMKEYYPSDFQKVKEYVSQGRWNICGSSLDAGDVNIPSPEAITRLILLGQKFYREEFGKTSRDIFLPDCFGFGYAFPSIAAHCGLKGFSTQKLTWGSSVGIPFDICSWEGVDGSKIFSALNPGDYHSDITGDLSNDSKWIATVDITGKRNGLYLGYRYFGTGDRGGAPPDSSVGWLEKSIAGKGPLKIINAPADLLCTQLTADQLGKLPQYNGELLMTTHGVGCYTSQCAIKRWNRKNELLADASERASVMADWFGGSKYPHDQLNSAWTRFLWHQFHDDITGTSIPEAYKFSWNDELLSLNQFSSILEDAVATVSRTLDTKVKGVPLVVYNPLSFEREDIVEAEIMFDQPVKNVKILDKTGKELLSQVIGVDGNKVKFLFIAKVPSVGFEVYDVQPSNKENSAKSEFKISEQYMENARYMIVFDVKTGDVKRLIDKQEKHDMLSGPLHIEFLDDESTVYPAWEITPLTIKSKPRSYLDKPKIEITENGPVRISLRITREKDGSVFTQYIRLAAGKPGERIDFDTRVNWNTKGTLVKAEFPFGIPNSKATYDLGMGNVQRGNNTDKLYEVPAQQWVDLTATDNSYGITIMNDCKYGWDKPNDNTLRLTLLHTPKTAADFSYQGTNDLGTHEFLYSIVAHKGDWREAKSANMATGLNQPLVAFQTKPHDGKLGKEFSFAWLNSPQVTIKAIKKAENSDEIVIRFQEMFGQKVGNVQLNLPVAVTAAREINGAEEPVGEARLVDGKLVFNMTSYESKTFAIKIADAPSKVTPKDNSPLKLDYNLDGVSYDSNRADGNIDGNNHTIPAELYPDEITCDGINFKLGPKTDGQKNFVACDGRKINLPEGNYNRAYILVTALADKKNIFKIDNTPVELSIPYYSGFIGQWYNRVSSNGYATVDSLIPAYLKRQPVAWVGTHRHNGQNNSNEAYVFCYLFKLAIDLPKGAKTLTLPDDKNILVAAITLCKDENANTKPAQILYH